MNQQQNAISLARVFASSLVGESQVWNLAKHRQGWMSDHEELSKMSLPNTLLQPGPIHVVPFLTARLRKPVSCMQAHWNPSPRRGRMCKIELADLITEFEINNWVPLQILSQFAVNWKLRSKVSQIAKRKALCIDEISLASSSLNTQLTENVLILQP